MTADLPPHVQKRIKKTDTCWIWSGRSNPDGYMRVKVDKTAWYAHRYVYAALAGPIGEGLTLDHLCKVRSCVNPDHLEPVTAAENLFRSGNHVAANLDKSHCVNGHPFNELNTRITYKDGRPRRICRPCRRATQLAYMQRLREAS